MTGRPDEPPWWLAERSPSTIEIELSDRIDVERWTWATHLVVEHGAYGSNRATPCYHYRGTIGSEELTRSILTEYERLSSDETPK